MVSGIDRKCHRIYDAAMWKTLRKILGGEKKEKCQETDSKNIPGSDEKNSPKPLETDLSRHYETLGVEPGANLIQIRRAWKQALKEVHMGHYADDTETKNRARERAQQLNEAYRALQDELF